MSFNTFTLVSANAFSTTWLTLYSGQFDSIGAARDSGEPSFRIYVNYPSVVISTVETAAGDGITVTDGRSPNAKTNDHTEGTAIVDMRTRKGARIIIDGSMYRVEQRAKQPGWKFLDPKGIKYKWNASLDASRWELAAADKNVLATLYLRKGHPKTVDIQLGLDKHLRTLALMSLVFSLATVTGQQPSDDNTCLPQQLGETLTLARCSQVA